MRTQVGLDAGSFTSEGKDYCISTQTNHMPLRARANNHRKSPIFCIFPLYYWPAEDGPNLLNMRTNIKEQLSSYLVV